MEERKRKNKENIGAEGVKKGKIHKLLSFRKNGTKAATTTAAAVAAAVAAAAITKRHNHRRRHLIRG